MLLKWACSFGHDNEKDRGALKSRLSKTICRAEIHTKGGKVFVSRDFEPAGEAHDNIGTDWLSAKFHRIAGCVMNENARDSVLKMVLGDENLPVRTLVDKLQTHITESYYTCTDEILAGLGKM